MSADLLPFPTAARPPEAVRADIRDEVARHGLRMDALLAELDGRPVRAGALEGDPTAERRDNKARAAEALGMTEQQLTRFVLDYHDAHPERAPLAIQPGELKNVAWIVFTDRVRVARESGKPTRRRTVKS